MRGKDRNRKFKSTRELFRAYRDDFDIIVALSRNGATLDAIADYLYDSSTEYGVEWTKRFYDVPEGDFGAVFNVRAVVEDFIYYITFERPYRED